MVGLSDPWKGVIQDTASTTTLLASSARASGHGLLAGARRAAGGSAPAGRVRLGHSHSLVDKAALLAGFGRDNIRHVACDDAYAMRADALAAMTAEIAAGRLPCAVVATTGTTTSTALDPCGDRRGHAGTGVWLHVDAAMAGSAMILPECRWMWDGVEGADSVVVNAHKWLGAAFDCTLYFVRDADQLVRVMSTNPSYLQSAADGRVNNYRDWGLPLGRRFRALKFWFLIREQGVGGLQARLRRDLENAGWLAEQVRATSGWEVLAPVPLQTLCVRHAPPGVTPMRSRRIRRGGARRSTARARRT